MWGLHVSCLLKSTLTLLHKHAYIHTNTSTHTVITDTERLQIPYNNKFVNEFLSALSTENSFLNCLMLTSGSVLALSKQSPNDQRCALAYTAACSRQALLHMASPGWGVGCHLYTGQRWTKTSSRHPLTCCEAFWPVPHKVTSVHRSSGRTATKPFLASSQVHPSRHVEMQEPEILTTTTNKSYFRESKSVYNIIKM